MKEAIDYYHDLISQPAFLQSSIEILQGESERLSVAIFRFAKLPMKS
jgi:hypothetical protein